MRRVARASCGNICCRTLADLYGSTFHRNRGLQKAVTLRQKHIRQEGLRFRGLGFRVNLVAERVH